MASPPNKLGRSSEDVDPDDILAELEADDNDTYRAQRLSELQSEAKESRALSTNAAHTIYRTLAGDDECLQFTTESERAVVHFFHPDFTRCSMMDRHCEDIAKKHNELGQADVAFARVDVKNAPFVVEKLGMRILPAVLGFAKGVVKGRVTGFEGIAWDGREEGAAVTAALEAKLAEWTVVKRRLLEDFDEDDDNAEQAEKSKYQRRSIRDSKPLNDNEDDDWD